MPYGKHSFLLECNYWAYTSGGSKGRTARMNKKKIVGRIVNTFNSLCAISLYIGDLQITDLLT